MNQAKIRLSQKEKELINNADWILTKNAVLKKIIQFYSELQQDQFSFLQTQKSLLPDRVVFSSPKISKGENYNGLPYVVLDYPRFFDDTGFGAVRTMFWWGNFFSITLHLSGQHKKEQEAMIIEAFDFLKEKGFHICINEKEWEHDFSTVNYVQIIKLSKVEFINIIEGKEFLKIACNIPLENGDEAESYLLEKFVVVTSLLADQLPSR
ncbi:MAG TPA: hypothetical protein VFV31_10185 [Chitinophagaceae bacterium]|nr:hypothetical protein [Chitinophagaceae bacterium]